MSFRIRLQLLLVFSLLILLTLRTLAQATSSPSLVIGPSDNRVSANSVGSISGRVLGDDGQPLADVSIVVASLSNSRSIRRITSTDEGGHFKVNNLPAGAYKVTATAPGFVNPQDRLSPVPYYVGNSITLTLMKGGVITGKVLNSSSQPLVGAPVSALRVRDAEGHAIGEPWTTSPRMTDDRGIYRIYGLPAGFYVVCSGGAGEILTSDTGAREVPTWYPSATRDSAQMVFVSAGSEIRDIDIQHRGDSGHAVSGKIVGIAEAGTISAASLTVKLFHSGTGTLAASSSVNRYLSHGFGIYGVADGEYEIIAQQQLSDDGTGDEVRSLASAPQHVIVHGSDITGVELRLAALGSIAGRIVLEKMEQSGCRFPQRYQVEEILLLPSREEPDSRRRTFIGLPPTATPDDKGEFIIRDLPAGLYRFQVQLPGDHWYVKAVGLTGAQTAGTPVSTSVASGLASSGIRLNSGRKLTGLRITITEGAASISGRISSRNLPSRLRVHLVPAESEAASDVLRYAEVIARDGNFSLKNLAPGKYWLVAHPVSDDETDEKPARPVAWDSEARLKLRREAEAANQSLNLIPCQHIRDLVIKF